MAVQQGLLQVFKGSKLLNLLLYLSVAVFLVLIGGSGLLEAVAGDLAKLLMTVLEDNVDIGDDLLAKHLDELRVGALDLIANEHLCEGPIPN